MRKYEKFYPFVNKIGDWCHCKKIEAVMLMPRNTNNPFKCLKEYLEIKPERIPLNDKEIYEIASWNHVTNALKTLWLDSGEYEMWAASILFDINSEAHRRGRAIQKRLNKRIPCYYWYHQDTSQDDYIPLEHCPTCKSSLEWLGRKNRGHKVCNKCKLVVPA